MFDDSRRGKSRAPRKIGDLEEGRIGSAHGGCAVAKDAHGHGAVIVAMVVAREGKDCLEKNRVEARESCCTKSLQVEAA